ncbi:class E sortase [Curtobacterium sp. MCBD17_035]|uniref:class E sortase n=1 Tax=Curtobacterium sp. MCBD17_035 TaxID=2175673 RepID=UPI000DA98F25|nr:class E sortase [Curtobacterium sp. MCBD17_035]WIB67468.1 class E sortase [Curtobacterium sp. MCBD17_035]
MTVTEVPVEGDAHAPSPDAGGRRRRRGHVTVLGVLGDLLITAGVLVLLFIAWQQWFNDLVVAKQHEHQAQQFSKSLGAISTPAPTPTQGYGPPKVSAQPGNTKVFGVMYVPRFSATYAVPMAGGTTTAGTLDTIGIGHYDHTQMPGQVGNFAVAGHRTTHGAPFNQIANLQVGDKIYLETADGFYTYTFRNLEYVPPTQVTVLDQDPDDVGVATKDRIMTMTSCNPMYSAQERIVAFSVFDSWQPRSAGAPTAIASEVKG